MDDGPVKDLPFVNWTISKIIIYGGMELPLYMYRLKRKLEVKEIHESYGVEKQEM